MTAMPEDAAEAAASHDDSVTQTASKTRMASVKLSSDFFQGMAPQAATDSRSRCRLIINGWAAQSILMIVVLLDFILGCVDTDNRAKGNESPLWIQVALKCCFASYVVELFAILYADRLAAFRSGWVRLDTVVCIFGIFELLAELLSMNFGFANIRILRLFRVARMLRLLKRLGRVQELKRMLQMAMNCLRTLLWSFILLAFLMTLWSVMAVEFLRPIIRDMAEENMWIDCESCETAFSSVMNSNFIFFKSIVAGDGWGRLAQPVIERHPWTAIIFIGALLTIEYGLLQLVMAVVVDTFAEQREKDERMMAKEMEESLEEDKYFLDGIFRRVDTDGDGELSLTELLDGARCVPEFQDRLRIMDIDTLDLHNLFYMLDSDGSDSVDPDEFISTISRWKHESKTASRFVKYNLLRVMKQQNLITDLLTGAGNATPAGSITPAAVTTNTTNVPHDHEAETKQLSSKELSHAPTGLQGQATKDETTDVNASSLPTQSSKLGPHLESLMQTLVQQLETVLATVQPQTIQDAASNGGAKAKHPQNQHENHNNHRDDTDHAFTQETSSPSISVGTKVVASLPEAASRQCASSEFRLLV